MLLGYKVWVAQRMQFLVEQHETIYLTEKIFGNNLKQNLWLDF